LAIIQLWSDETTQLDMLSGFRLEARGPSEPEQPQRSSVAKVSAIADAQGRATARPDIAVRAAEYGACRFAVRPHWPN
jgi:hypothetical protein